MLHWPTRFPNSPPVRYQRLPPLTAQGSKNMSWLQERGSIQKDNQTTYVWTRDSEPCSGCKCPSSFVKVSPHIIKDLDKVQHYCRNQVTSRKLRKFLRAFPRSGVSGGYSHR